MSRPRAERMHAQQWLYDRLIQASGPDFYWGMTGRALRTVGADGSRLAAASPSPESTVARGGVVLS